MAGDRCPPPCPHTDLKVGGFAMYYFTYDPWVGKQLYLEEFYVMNEYRGESSSSCPPVGPEHP